MQSTFGAKLRFRAEVVSGLDFELFLRLASQSFQRLVAFNGESLPNPARIGHWPFRT
ncbi:hypothetical protein [Novosphingobium clariflavum]|uniref:Uncharacterized protein n=1 Tax=Novosphingobium clariflavum TaxID=2029884 RepID=A0ABV6S6N1_9SPHN|nr:hypothetical protein [Novosphingobium clariflavum]